MYFLEREKKFLNSIFFRSGSKSLRIWLIKTEWKRPNWESRKFSIALDFLPFGFPWKIPCTFSGQTDFATKFFPSWVQWNSVINWYYWESFFGTQDFSLSFQLTLFFSVSVLESDGLTQWRFIFEIFNLQKK